jgi:hypothetical protein
MLMQCVCSMQPERRERAKVGEALGATYASERSEEILQNGSQKAACNALECTLYESNLCCSSDWESMLIRCGLSCLSELL